MLLCPVCDIKIEEDDTWCLNCETYLHGNYFEINDLRQDPIVKDTVWGVLIGIELEHSEVALWEMVELLRKHKLKKFVHQVKTDNSIPFGCEVTLIPTLPEKAFKRLMLITKIFELETLPSRSPSAIHFHIMFPRKLSKFELWKLEKMAKSAFKPFEKLRCEAGSELKHYPIESGSRASTARVCQKSRFTSIEWRVFPAYYNLKVVATYFNLVMWLHKVFTDSLKTGQFVYLLNKKIRAIIRLLESCK